MSATAVRAYFQNWFFQSKVDCLNVISIHWCLNCHLGLLELWSIWWYLVDLKIVILQGPGHGRQTWYIALIKTPAKTVKSLNSNTVTTSFITWFQMLFHILALFGLIYARRSHMCIQSYILSHFQMWHLLPPPPPP